MKASQIALLDRTDASASRALSARGRNESGSATGPAVRRDSLQSGYAVSRGHLRRGVGQRLGE